MRLFSHSPADSSLPELAPPCSCSAVLHVTWVLSISRSTAITSLCKYSGWYPTFHALLSHYALIQASSLDASFGRTLLLYILQHPRDQSSPLWTVRSLSSVTCHWLPCLILCWKGTCILYIHSTITFWNASSRIAWATDTDGKHEVQSQHAIKQPGSNDLCLQSLKVLRSLLH